MMHVEYFYLSPSTFQDDKDLVHEFVVAEGLTCLIKVGAEADQNYQNYILRGTSTAEKLSKLCNSTLTTCFPLLYFLTPQFIALPNRGCY